MYLYIRHPIGQWYCRDISWRPTYKQGCHCCCYFRYRNKCSVRGECSSNTQMARWFAQVWRNGEFAVLKTVTDYLI